MLLLLVGTLALFVVPRIRRRGAATGAGKGAGWSQGTLLITGVSPRPDAAGEQFVTITGVITGPTVNEHVVYQRLVVDTGEWPSMGQLIPVMYSTRNPDNWTFAPREMPPA